MQDIEEQTLLQQLAYQSWQDRGKPLGSPEVDWAFAKAQLGIHIPLALPTADHEQLDRTDDA